MSDPEIDVKDVVVEDVEPADEPGPEDQADEPDRCLDDLIDRSDQLVARMGELIDLMRVLVKNTAKPEREPLPPKVPAGESAGEVKRSIYNI